MRRLAPAALMLALAGCAMLPVQRDRPAPALPTARAVYLARVRCLLVAPFENASDDPLAAEAATGTFVAAIDANRTRVYPIAELRALFKDTSLELPEGVSPSLALELAELIGADAALYGAVEGRSRGSEASMSVTIRLAATGARDLLFAKVVDVQPRADEATADVVRRAVLEAAQPMLERLGVPGRKVCFDRQRTDRLRFMALAGEQRSIFPPAAPVTAALPPAPAPAAPLPPPPMPAEPAPQTAEIGDVQILEPLPRPPPRPEPKVESAADLPEEEAPAAVAVAEAPKPVEPALPAQPAAVPAEASPVKPETAPAKKTPPKKEKKVRVAAVEKASPREAEPAAAPPAKTMTVRQAEWLTRLQSGERVFVDDVTFAGRTAQLEKERGLADVVALLGVATGLKLRIEGFVDASNDPDGDLRVSMEMARATGKRLIELGVARDRLTWAGRGGESPILPNFTARGRMANRRIELLAAP